MKFNQTRVNVGWLSLSQGTQLCECQSDGNSHKRRSSCLVVQSAPSLLSRREEDRKSDHTTLVQVKEEEVVTHTATEMNLRQGRQACVAPAETWLRDNLEEVYALIFRFLGYGFRLAMSNVGWLVTQKFVILVPDPIGFAPWSVLFGRGEPCDSF